MSCPVPALEVSAAATTKPWLAQCDNRPEYADGPVPVPMPHSHVPDQTPHITHAVSIALPHSTEIEEAHYMPMTDSFMDAIARFQGTTPPVTHI